MMDRVKISEHKINLITAAERQITEIISELQIKTGFSLDSVSIIETAIDDCRPPILVAQISMFA